MFNPNWKLFSWFQNSISRFSYLVSKFLIQSTFQTILKTFFKIAWQSSVQSTDRDFTVWNLPRSCRSPRAPLCADVSTCDIWWPLFWGRRGWGQGWRWTWPRRQFWQRTARRSVDEHIFGPGKTDLFLQIEKVKKSFFCHNNLIS